MDTMTAHAEKLYSPRQIGIAAFLGSPAAAGWFVSHNERALGRAGTRWLLGSLAMTAVLLVLGFFLPEKFPSVILPLACSMGIRAWAKQLYERPLAEHLVNGGNQGSWWMVVGISLLIFAVLMALIFGVVLLLPDNMA